MSRYIREEMIQKPADFVDFIISDFLQKHGFKLVNVNGELVYQHGKGMVTMPKYFCYRYANGVIHLEAWVKYAWFPGVYGKESDLNGYMGSVPKNAYRKDIEELIRVLYQPLPSDYQNGYVQSNPNLQAYNNQMQGGGYVNGQPVQEGGYFNGQPVQGGGYVNGQPVQGGGYINGQPVQGGGYVNGQPVQGGPVTVKGVDTGNNAKVGLLMVLVAIPFMFLTMFTAWCAFVFIIMGIAYCYRGMGSSKNGMAVTGFVLGIIELILVIVIIVGSIMNLWNLILA